jgi:hypothetical protein
MVEHEESDHGVWSHPPRRHGLQRTVPDPETISSVQIDYDLSDIQTDRSETFSP